MLLRGLVTGARGVRHAQCRWASASQWQQWKEQVRNHAQESQASASWVKENGSPFAVLGVKEEAPMDEVKAAYRRLSLTNHPDKGGDLEQFQKIQNAYNMINKGTYQSEDKMGYESLNGSKKFRLYAIMSVVGLVGLYVAYIVILLPLRWLFTKIGLLSPSQPAQIQDTPESSLREEVKKLQNQVEELQETLAEVRDAVNTNRRRRKP